MDIPNLTFKKEENANHQSLRLVLLCAILVAGFILISGWILNENINASQIGIRQVATIVSSIPVEVEPSSLAASNQNSLDSQRVYSAVQLNIQPFRPSTVIYYTIGLLFVLLAMFVLVIAVNKGRMNSSFHSKN